MAVPVAGLGERLTTEFTFERHVVVVYTKVVSEIAELWEFQWTLFTLQYLIHPFSVAVQSMDQKVVSLVNDLLVADQHGPLAFREDRRTIQLAQGKPVFLLDPLAERVQSIHVELASIQLLMGFTRHVATFLPV